MIGSLFKVIEDGDCKDGELTITNRQMLINGAGGTIRPGKEYMQGFPGLSAGVG